MTPSSVIKAIAVTSELCGGRQLSESAARVFADDLAPYAETLVLDALQRCRREVRGSLTIADVIARIDDGRPGPEEAWAMLPHDEATTVVWTTEMAEAWGIAREAGDQIASRMAFKEAYARIVSKARSERQPAHWQASLGHNVEGREPVLLRAVELGRLTQTHVSALLPYHKPTEESRKLLVAGVRMLADKSEPEDERTPMPDNVRAFLRRA